MVGREIPTQGRERGPQVQAMFDRLAGRYDLLNDVLSMGLHRHWRTQAALAGRPRGGEVLDLATGTGDLAILCHRAGARRVIGVDFSGAMLRGAQTKLHGHGLGETIALVQGDALHLPFPDASFDVVTSAFLLRNLADLEAGFREMRRLLRPGGRAVALDITPLGHGFGPTFVRWYFRQIVPVLGGLLTGEWDAYRYLPASVEILPTAEQLGTLLLAWGYSKVTFRRMGMGSVALHVAEA